MTSTTTELALAASRTRELAQSLSVAEVDQMVASWIALRDELDQLKSDGERQIVVIEWRAAIEQRFGRRKVPR